MPRHYSRRNLAQLIADDHDTSSAARMLGVPLDYAIKEQQTDEYLRYLSQFRRTKRRLNRRIAVRTVSATPTDPDDSDDTSKVPLDVTLVRKVQIDGLEEHTLTFEYNIGPNGRPGRFWGAKWYGSIADLEAGIPELGPTRTPRNVSIRPAELMPTEGLHFFHLTFTPRFGGDHYLAFVLDPDAETPDPVRPTVGTFVVDANNDAIVDGSGNFVISTGNEVWNYEVDSNGYNEVDAHGNRIVEISHG
ncbi:hypothetical protein F4Z99_20005 [Candidatus Poribacteria bacterium]|nr:hypothetical protein [Candidatus Poribacteria bacterium]